MSVDRLCSAAEHAITVLRNSATEHRKAENLTDAGLCEVTARALEAALRHVFASPLVDADPHESAYLENLRSTLGIGATGPKHRGTFTTTELAQWLVDALLEGREHVLALRDPAELFATDIEMVAKADQWVAKVDRGPPISRPSSPPGPPPPPFPKLK